MAYGLPARGQRDWDDELNNSVESLRGDVQSAVADAATAKSNATTAITSADAAKAEAALSAQSAATAAAAASAPADEAVEAVLSNPASASSAVLSATYGRPALDTTYLPRAVPGHLFTTRNAAPVYGAQVMAVNMTSRVRALVLSRPGTVRIGWGHWNTGSAGDDTPAGSVTFRASIEQGGWIIPLTFNGQRDMTLREGMTYCDPIVIDSAVTEVYVRTFVTAASAAAPRANAYAVGSNGEGREGGDHTAVAAISADVIDAFNTYVWGPAVILTNPVPGADYRALGIAGDSIAYGQGDAPVGDGVGFLVRAAERDAVPFLMAARAGEVLNAITGINYRHRGPLLSAASHVITTHSRNDITAGNTLPTVQNNSVKWWRRMADSGPKVYQTTITPRTTSTDSWASTGNQTVANAGEEAVRVGLNTWLRAGAPLDATTLSPVAVGASGALVAGDTGHPLVGVVEIADSVESARDSGIWKAGHTADGLHPNGTGHAAMAAAVDLVTLLAA